MDIPLMPKATAVWLIENTSLTFDQIADFCHMHPLEIKGIADGEVACGIVGVNPISSGELSRESISEAEKDPNKKLHLAIQHRKTKEKGRKTKYIPIARRQDKPDAICWFVKNFPQMKDSQIAKLVGSTKNTIEAIRSRTHWNSQNIKPRDPVLLGICKQVDLDKIIAKLQIEEDIQNV